MTLTKPVSVCLGLQGGGTYGAFGWGVLDRLLAEELLEIQAISGASGGAINAAVAADGYAHGGGREGARRALERFWRALGQASLASPLQRTPLDILTGHYSLERSPAYHMLEMAAAMAGPVPDTPLSHNPLRKLLEATIDFDRVRACRGIALFVNAINVRTGIGALWTREELDVQKLLASACLPTVFGAAEVEGELYWDGSFVANPPLAPLVEQMPARDIIVVQNNPIARAEAPRSMADISNRAHEIAFNISFVREISALRHTGGLPEESRGTGMAFAASRLHLITGNPMLSELSISSKFISEPVFLQHLHDRGVEAAERWLAEHGGSVGLRSTFDPEPVHYPDRMRSAG